MKKQHILSFIGCLGLVVSMTSCQDKTYCYDCVSERYYVTLPESDTTRLDSEMKVYCDHDDNSIKGVEQAGTTFITYTKDGKLIQEHTKMTCKP